MKKRNVKIEDYKVWEFELGENGHIHKFVKQPKGTRKTSFCLKSNKNICLSGDFDHSES